MSGRVVNQMGLAEDNQNFLLMYSISVNVSGQIASVIAGGLILTPYEQLRIRRSTHVNRTSSRHPLDALRRYGRHLPRPRRPRAGGCMH